jgi:putative two-component system response regulator
LSTVRAFVSSLEAKDTYTARPLGARRRTTRECWRRPAATSVTISTWIVFGAMLHDIGKIGVAEGHSQQAGTVDPGEWRVVRAHPEMGARIVSHIDYLSPAVGLILHHHERIDGRGYPHGLSGDEIELGARIVTVVDSFDAMTTHRPYRRAMDIGQAVKLLKTHAGRQFDAQIVDTFLALLEAGTVRVKS